MNDRTETVIDRFEAAFLRLLDRPTGADDAVTTVERVLELLEWRLLNEFKHTSVPR